VESNLGTHLRANFAGNRVAEISLQYSKFGVSFLLSSPSFLIVTFMRIPAAGILGGVPTFVWTSNSDR
jgi:hypothetical protein